MKQWVALFSVLMLAGCFSAGKNRESKVKHFDKQGHRGCRGLMPENTIPAMLTALTWGVTTLETDAVITKDGKVVLSHEPFFNHEITTKPDGSPVSEKEEKQLNIFQMTYAEVKKFDVGMRQHPRFPEQKKIPVSKPLLAEMIDSVEQFCLQNKKPLPYYNIETKSNPATDNIFHPAPAEFVEMIMQVVFDKKIQDRVIIQSFDPRTLQYLHKKYPDITTALLIEDFDSKTFALQLQNLGFLPAIYSPAYTLVTPLLVKQCRDTGIKLIPWTVNDPKKIADLRTMGVDGIISDYPNMFK